jgi:hypothetical protein
MQYRRCGRIWPLLAVILFTAAPATSSFAKLYKWVDDDGNVTYSGRKPPDKTVEEIKLRGIAPPAPAEDEQAGGEPSADVAETTEADDKEHAERLSKNCEIARKNVTVLENADPVLSKDKDGKTFVLKPGEIRSRLELSRQHVERYCK